MFWGGYMSTGYSSVTKEAHLWWWSFVVGRMDNLWSINRERLGVVSGACFRGLSKDCHFTQLQGTTESLFLSFSLLKKTSQGLAILSQRQARSAFLGFHADKGLNDFPPICLASTNPWPLLLFYQSINALLALHLCDLLAPKGIWVCYPWHRNPLGAFLALSC